MYIKYAIINGHNTGCNQQKMLNPRKMKKAKVVKKVARVSSLLCRGMLTGANRTIKISQSVKICGSAACHISPYANLMAPFLSAET
jgi:hypothetical protein